MEELCRNLESPANDEAWYQYPGIFLWVLLTAVAAARGIPEHSFLLSLLTKTGFGAGYGGWKEMCEGWTKFRWVKRRAEEWESKTNEQEKT